EGRLGETVRSHARDVAEGRLQRNRRQGEDDRRHRVEGPDQLDDPANVLLVLLDGAEPEHVPFRVEDVRRNSTPEDAARLAVLPDLRKAEGEDEGPSPLELAEELLPAVARRPFGDVAGAGLVSEAPPRLAARHDPREEVED